MAENNTRGVFSIGDIRKRQLVGLVTDKTRESYREFGYFGGGYSIKTFVHRIDYSNDTVLASARSPLPTSQDNGSSFGNSNYGWFSQGRQGSRTSISRIDYSNETSSIRGPLSSSSYQGAGCSNSNFGYTSGGNTVSSVLQRTDFSNDLSTSLRRGSLNTSRTVHASTGNFNFGYFGGGYIGGGNTPNIERSNYANDTVRNISRTNAQSSQRHIAISNKDYAFFGGGTSSDVRRISFANDTQTASVRGPLTSSFQSLGSSGNSNFGYFVGGASSIPQPQVSTINRIDYSNDTATALVRGVLPLGIQGLRGTSSSSFGGAKNSAFASNFTFPTVPNAGYFGGGSDGTNSLASIDKVDYANDTATASVRSSLSSAKIFVKSVSNNNFGYYNGATAYPATSSTIDRIEFSSDTQNTVVRGPLSIARNRGAATGNSNFGYFGGGYAPGNSSTIDRINYSNDSATASNRCLLTLARRDFSATGNQNFGYFGGGFSSVAVTAVDRLDYSNDTLNTLSRGGIIARYDNMAVGNQNFGYFGGGTPGVSSVDRLDYSNDTQTSSVRGPLSSGRGSSAVTGNNNFGYIGGGFTPSGSPIYYSTTDRINYSNDTAIASVRGPLPVAKSSLAATSPLGYGGAPIYFTNPLPEVFQKQIVFNDSNTLNLPFKRVLGSYGYFGGGYNPYFSTINRINFSNDTAIGVTRGSLTASVGNFAATGNSNFGYFGGGLRSDLVTVATVNRVDYSNDSATSSSRGSLSLARQYLGSTGNNNFGWFVGGPFSRVDRIDYSNDNTTASIRGSLSLNFSRISGVGNNNFGYFGGGYTSIIQRVNYVNDNVTATSRGPINLSKAQAGSTGNSNFGYFGGGISPAPSSYIRYSTVDRIDYSNDLTITSVRGPLSIGRWQLSATGNSNFGYFGPGNSPTSPSASTALNRIDYSNDTATAPIRGQVSTVNMSGYAATTNASNS